MFVQTADVLVQTVDVFVQTVDVVVQTVDVVVQMVDVVVQTVDVVVQTVDVVVQMVDVVVQMVDVFVQTAERRLLENVARVRDIELLTGLRFFPDLDPAFSAQLRTHRATSLWTKPGSWTDDLDSPPQPSQCPSRCCHLLSFCCSSCLLI